MNIDINTLIQEVRVQEGLLHARLSTIEGVIADFFRLVLSAKEDSQEDILDGLEQMSKKLLRQQEVLIATKARASQRRVDLMEASKMAAVNAEPASEEQG